MPSEWISIEDRLPENHTPVLIKERWEDDIGIAYLLEHEWQEQHINHVCTGNATCNFEVPEVTHWMPLPEPPE